MFVRDTLAVNGQPLTNLKLVAQDFSEWQPIEISCSPQPNVIAAVLRIAAIDLGPPQTALGDPLWRWRWQPQHAVGVFPALLTLDYADGTRHEEAFDLRIAPRKLDWEQYEALILAVQREACALVYALSGGRAGAQLGPISAHRSLVEEYVVLVERLAGEAIAITKQIAARPHTTLRTHPTRSALHEIERIDPATLHDMARESLDNVADDVLPPLQQALRPAEQRQGGPLPRTLPATRCAATPDVIEHRVLKHVLEVLQWRVGFVRDMLRREQQRRRRNAALLDAVAPSAAIDQWQAHCTAVLRELRQCLAQPLFVEVGALHHFSGPTHLMRHDPRYRRLHAVYRSLRTTPFIAFDSPTLWLPIQELPALYEQWCALQAIKALLPLGEVVAQTLITRDGDDERLHEHRWTLRLRQDAPLLTLRLPNSVRLTLHYQRRYRPQPPDATILGALDPFVRIPDIAIEVDDGQGPRVLILDAKYRVAPDGRVPQDALDDAYAYRGAIGVRGARATLGAFLLFPGDTPLTTADQVGALPLLPDRTNDLHEIVRRFFGAA